MSFFSEPRANHPPSDPFETFDPILGDAPEPLIENGTRTLLGTCTMLLVGILFFLVLAYRLDMAPDIHMDEIIYYRAAYSIATEGEFTWDIDPIFVHPPMQFLTQAIFLKAIGLTDEFLPFQGTYSARLVNAMIASVTAMVLFRLTERLGGFRAAVMVSSLLIIDPYVVRINRRNMLETMAEFWVVLALYLYWRHRNEMRLPQIFAVGIVFGLGLLTKELVIFAYATLVIFVVVTGRWQEIKKAILIGCIAMSVWGLFPFWSWTVGQWDVFIANKTFNLRRLLGLVQITGWNREGVSFVGALGVNLPQYATSYALIVVGIPFLILLALTWRDEKGRFILSWAGMKYAFFAYCIVGGALNDQFFYFLIVPVVTMIGLMISKWIDLLLDPNATDSMDDFRSNGVLVLNHLDEMPNWLLPRYSRPVIVWLDAGLLVMSGWLSRVGRLMSRVRILSFTLLGLTFFWVILMLGYNGQRWVQLFIIEEDRTLQDLAEFIETSIPPGTTINSMFEDAEPTLHLMLPEYEMVTLRKPAVIEAREVEYAILSSKNLWGAYGEITPNYYTWVQTNGELIYSTYGNTYWDVEIYRFDFGATQTQEETS